MGILRLETYCIWMDSIVSKMCKEKYNLKISNIFKKNTIQINQSVDNTNSYRAPRGRSDSPEAAERLCSSHECAWPLTGGVEGV